MKRPGDAISAFERLRVRSSRCNLWVVGDGPELRRLVEKDAARALSSSVACRKQSGSRALRAHMSSSSTSIREGWGLNVSEAAALGTPSIGYAVPGLVDSVRASGGALVRVGQKPWRKR